MYRYKLFAPVLLMSGLLGHDLPAQDGQALVTVLSNAKQAIQDQNAYLEWWSEFENLSDAQLATLLESDDDSIIPYPVMTDALSKV